MIIFDYPVLSNRSLHWAGDHTAFVTHDKLAGAFWSGERAANEVVATITRAPSALEHAAGVWYHDHGVFGQ